MNTQYKSRTRKAQVSTSLLLICVAMTMLGCGGGSDTRVDIDPGNGSNPEAPKVNRADISASILKPSTNESFSRLLKNGLYYNNFQTSNVVNAVASDSLASAVPSAESASPANFSQTITQEAGVDEMDIMKFEVDLNGNASMANTISVRPPSRNDEYSWATEDRAVVIGDIIYYVKGAQVWQTTINDALIINGPY